ncbi:type VI secretion system baseplate subunit TssG, partial [Escherichia coli O8:H10]
EYDRFLPGEAWVTALRDWVRQYLGLEYQWDTQILLRADAVRGVALGGGGRLGYNTWLGQQPLPIPRGDLVFSAEL